MGPFSSAWRRAARGGPVLIQALALSLAGTAAWAQSPDYRRDRFLELPGLLWDDARTLAVAPGDWTASEWKEAGLGAAAVLGVALVLDKPFDQAALRNRTESRDRLARDVAQVGGTGGLILMGAAYGGFTLIGKPEPRSVVVDMGIATVLAQVAILPLKYGFGRVRPADGLGNDAFKPFTANDSFPSGHAAQAFAMASVLSLRTENPWIGYCAYGAAGLVALARIETRDHFGSDVVAGGLVGTVIGRSVAKLDQNRRLRSGKAQITVSPLVAPGFQGLVVNARF